MNKQTNNKRRIQMIVKKIVVGDYMVNCYLLGCTETKEIAVIDPGADSEEIIRVITEEALIPKMILLTHAHGDHIGDVQVLKERYNIPVYIHDNDKHILSNSELNFTEMMFGKKVEIIADKTFKDKDIINLGTLKIEVLHTPGHTLGGTSFKCNNIIFSGDSLFEGSIGRTDFPDSSYEQLIKSIKTKLMLYNDNTIFYPGHGPETNIKREKDNNPFLK
jgi:hydroxyacylglutathione hydrolase